MALENKNVAIVDIGSNSVRIRISFGDQVIFRDNVTTQLARGAMDGVLNEQSVERTFLGLDRLFDSAKKYEAQVFAFATAAVRNSRNKNEFCNRFYNRYGVELAVLSGEEEAEMGILGALNGDDGCVIDVGGASSELVIAKNGAIVYAYSMQLGAVSLTDACGKDFDRARLLIEEQIKAFPPLPSESGEVYSIGGTSNNVAFIKSGISVFDRDKTSGYRLKNSEFGDLVQELYALTPQEISLKYNVRELRSKVIHSGALLLYSLFNLVGAKQVIMTENDNLEGYFLAKTKGKRYEKQKN